MQRIQCIQWLHNCYVLYCVTLLCLPPNTPLESRHSAVPKWWPPFGWPKTYENVLEINDLGMLALLGVQQGLKRLPDGPKTPQDGLKTAQDGPKRVQKAPKKA